MSTPPPLLGHDLLTRFERALNGVEAAITRVWAPGIDDAEIDSHLQGLGFDLPEEARRWWRWHNGFVPGTRGPDWDLVPSRTLLDLATVLELHQDTRDLMLQMEGVDGRLEPVGGQSIILFDCRVDRDAPVPIYLAPHAEDQRLVLPSIGALVETWITLIELGIYRTDVDGTWLNVDYERLPADIARLGVY